MSYVNKPASIIRRRLTLGLALAPLAGIALTSRAKAAACNDPEHLTSADIALRESFEYVENSAHEGKSCSGCSYYSADQAAACGNCLMLNGPVNPKGHCSSWSARS